MADIDITAITDHRLQSVTVILGRYLVRTSTMAESAFQKRLDHEAVKAGTDSGV